MSPEDIQSEKFQLTASRALFGVTFAAWIFSVASLASCTWVHINSGDVSLGLFSRNLSRGGCKPYGSTMDGAHGAARFFAVVTNLALLFSLFGQVFALFLRLPERFAAWRATAWSWSSYVLVAAVFTNLLSFVFFASRWKSAFCDSEECSPGAAAVLAVLNVFLTTGGAVVAARWIVLALSDDANEDDVDKKEVARLVSEHIENDDKTEIGEQSRLKVDSSSEPAKQEEDVGVGVDNEDDDGTKEDPDPSPEENTDVEGTKVAM